MHSELQAALIDRYDIALYSDNYDQVAAVQPQHIQYVA